MSFPISPIEGQIHSLVSGISYTFTNGGWKKTTDITPATSIPFSITSSRNLTAADNGAVLVNSTTSPLVLNVVPGLPLGFGVALAQESTGSISFSNSGVTMDTTYPTTNGINTVIVLVQVGTDSYIITGGQQSFVTSVAGKTGAVVLHSLDVGLGNVDNTSDINKPISTAQAAVNMAVSSQIAGKQNALVAGTNISIVGNTISATGGGAVTSVNTRTGAITLTSTDVGLGNVNNTSDANKPVSTAQAAAIATAVAGVTSPSVGSLSALSLPVQGTDLLSISRGGVTNYQTAISNVLPTSAVYVDVFPVSGTWTKRTGVTLVQVKIWSGGGSGAAGFSGSSTSVAAGGGGAGASGYFANYTFTASDLPSTVSVTVGAGGLSLSGANAYGQSGGLSSFGSFLSTPFLGYPNPGSSTTYGNSGYTTPGLNALCSLPYIPLFSQPANGGFNSTGQNGGSGGTAGSGAGGGSVTSAGVTYAGGVGGAGSWNLISSVVGINSVSNGNGGTAGASGTVGTNGGNGASGFNGGSGGGGGGGGITSGGNGGNGGFPGGGGGGGGGAQNGTGGKGGAGANGYVVVYSW